jgi:hypothetical protein
MKVVVYIEHGCLGPSGEEFIKPFCRHFSNYLRRQMGYMKLDIAAVPREFNDPEFRYISNNSLDENIDDAAIASAISRFNLSRSEFEEELTQMAVSFAASPEWRKVISATGAS